MVLSKSVRRLIATDQPKTRPGFSSSNTGRGLSVGWLSGFFTERVMSAAVLRSSSLAADAGLQGFIAAMFDNCLEEDLTEIP